MCIGGLTLIVTSVLSISFQSKNLTKLFAEIETQAITLSAEIENIRLASEELSSEVDTVNKGSTETPTNTIENLADRRNKIVNNLDRFSEKELQLQGMTRTHQILSSHFKLDLAYLRHLILIGSLLTGVGFTLWYNRHQKYLDMIIKRQAGQK